MIIRGLVSGTDPFSLNLVQSSFTIIGVIFMYSFPLLHREPGAFLVRSTRYLKIRRTGTKPNKIKWIMFFCFYQNERQASADKLVYNAGIHTCRGVSPHFPFDAFVLLIFFPQSFAACGQSLPLPVIVLSFLVRIVHIHSLLQSTYQLRDIDLVSNHLLDLFPRVKDPR